MGGGILTTSVIRHPPREETAATRSRLNTARVMEANLTAPAFEGAGDSRKGDREDRQDVRLRQPGCGAQGSGEDPVSGMVVVT